MEIPTSSPETTSVTPAQDLHRGTVLFVTNNAIESMSVQKAFRRERFTLNAVTHENAFNAYTDDTKLAVVDWGAHGEGKSLVSSLYDTSEGKLPFVIFTTDSESRQQAETYITARGLNARIVDKPYQAPQLMAVVNKLVPVEAVAAVRTV